MSNDSLGLHPTKTELRRLRADERLIDAARVREEMAAAAVARDDKTARLRALRLTKEAAESAATQASSPPKGGRRRVKMC